MNPIFVAQTKLRLNADTGLNSTDHAALTAQIIKFEKPDGTAGNFVATAGTAPYIYYDTVNASDLDQAGSWIIWAYCTFTGSLVAAGAKKTIVVSIQGDA